MLSSSQNAEVLRIKRLRVATLLVAPIFWVDPVTNATSITGFSQLSLSWSQALAGAVQASCQMDVLLTSYGNQNIDSERIFIPGSTYPNVAEFTIRLDEKGAHDLGWGAIYRRSRCDRSGARSLAAAVVVGARDRVRKLLWRAEATTPSKRLPAARSASVSSYCVRLCRRGAAAQLQRLCDPPPAAPARSSLPQATAARPLAPSAATPAPSA